MLTNRNSRSINGLVVSSAICLVSPLIIAQTSSPRWGTCCPSNRLSRPQSRKSTEKTCPTEAVSSHSAEACAQCQYRFAGSVILRHPDAMGGPIKTPVFRRPSENRPSLYQLPRQRPMLTHPAFTFNRSNPASRECCHLGRFEHVIPRRYRQTADSVATIAEIMRRWGNVTGYFGKSHELPPYEYKVSGSI